MANPDTYSFWKQLKDAGVNLPDDVSRIVIDVQANERIKVYYETYASKEIMDVVVESLMLNKDDIEIKEVR
jgi:hypothetical protein